METCVVTLFTYSTLSTDTVFDLIAGGREEGREREEREEGREWEEREEGREREGREEGREREGREGIDVFLSHLVRV